MRRLSVYFTLAALALTAGAAKSDAQGIYAEILPRPRPPTTQPPGPAQSRLILERHQIKADVRDGLASYRIDQTFRNPSDATIEGIYLFPIPRDAIARGILLTIDGKEVAGEVLNVEQARGIYREIVRKMRDPALLEFVDNGLLRASIFPIAPRAEVKVALEFAAQAERIGAVESLALPLRFAAEAGAQVLVDVGLQTSAPLTTIYSPSHAVDIARDGQRKARITFEGKTQQRGDFLLYYASDEGDLGMSLLCHRLPAKDGHFVLVLSPRAEVRADQASPRDLVFVLDRSGSMAGAKWEQAIAALKYGLSTLNPQDRFALLSFATDVRAYKPGLVAASREEIAGATAHLGELRPAGGTNISGSIDQALALLDTQDGRLRMVAYLTDGLPTIGEVQPERILAAAAERKSDARVFAFGIGFDVNTFLLDRLAEDHRGRSAYIADGESLELRVSSFFAKVAEPVLIDPKLTITGIEIHDVYPPRLPDLYAGDAMIVTGRYRGTGNHAITLSGRHGQGERTFVTEASFADANADNKALPSVWAARKVGYLLNEIRLHGADKELVDAVIDVGREYGIVTPYTAGLVVEEGMQLGLSADLPATRGLSDGRWAPAPAAAAEVRRDLEALGYTAGGGPAGPASPGGARAGAPGDKQKSVGREAVAESKALYELADALSTDKDAFIATRGELKVERLQASGRQLVRIGSAVVDLAFKPAMKEGAVDIQTFSEAWFALLDADPSLRELLSLGEEILFVKDGKAWRIHP